MLRLVEHVLAEYPAECQPWEIQSLGSAGGFSGARIWRCQTRLGPLCLRRWPPGQSLGRLTEIHALLRHVASQGCTLGPVPLATRRGACGVACDGALWDLTTWLPGEAIARVAEPHEVEAALAALARLHLAAASFSIWPAQPGPAPVLSNRLAVLSACSAQQQQKWRMALACHPWPELPPRALELLDLAPRRLCDVARRLQNLKHSIVPLQASLPDVWRANVLWQGSRVSGIVDWASARCDSPAADIARLLGSLAADDQALWQIGLSAYQQARPLDRHTLALVAVLDAANVVLAPLTWLHILLDEERDFADPGPVLQRLDECLARLRRAPPPAP